jgi:hypothetical protein
MRGSPRDLPNASPTTEDGGKSQAPRCHANRHGMTPGLESDDSSDPRSDLGSAATRETSISFVAMQCGLPAAGCPTHTVIRYPQYGIQPPHPGYLFGFGFRVQAALMYNSKPHYIFSGTMQHAGSSIIVCCLIDYGAVCCRS